MVDTRLHAITPPYPFPAPNFSEDLAPAPAPSFRQSTPTAAAFAASRKTALDPTKVVVKASNLDTLAAFFAKQREATGVAPSEKPPSVASHTFYNGRRAPSAFVSAKTASASASSASSSSSASSASAPASQQQQRQQAADQRPKTATSAIARGGASGQRAAAAAAAAAANTRKRPMQAMIHHGPIELPSDEEYPSGAISDIFSHTLIRHLGNHLS